MHTADLTHLSERGCAVNMYGFLPGSSFVLAGQSGGGKSTFIKSLLLNRELMFESDPPKKIRYHYGIWSPMYDELQSEIPEIEFISGLPSEEEVMSFTSPTFHSVIVLDDLMQVSNALITELLFCRISHHRKCSVLLVLQNLYHQGNRMKTISLNSKYVIIFRSPRDVKQLGVLGQQMFPRTPRAIVEAYEDVMSKHKYGHLVIDTTSECDNDKRIRSQVLPGQETVCYVPI